MGLILGDFPLRKPGLAWVVVRETVSVTSWLGEKSRCRQMFPRESGVAFSVEDSREVQETSGGSTLL